MKDDMDMKAMAKKRLDKAAMESKDEPEHEAKEECCGHCGAPVDGKGKYAAPAAGGGVDISITPRK